MKLRPIIIALYLLVLLLGWNTASHAQTPPTAATPNESSLLANALRAAMMEIRQLRVTLQQSTINDHRAQILIEQIVRQTNRVDALEEDLAQQKFDLVLAMLRLEKEIPLDIKEFEVRLEDVNDLEPRVNLEVRLADAKRDQQRMEEQLQQDRQKILEAQTALGHGQQHLRDLENQLRLLTQELDTLLQPTKSAQRKMD